MNDKELCMMFGTTPDDVEREVEKVEAGDYSSFDPSNPCGFNAEILAAMDDVAAGRVSGPYDTVSDMMAALDED